MIHPLNLAASYSFLKLKAQVDSDFSVGLIVYTQLIGSHYTIMNRLILRCFHKQCLRTPFRQPIPVVSSQFRAFSNKAPDTRESQKSHHPDTIGWRTAEYLNATILNAPRTFLMCMIASDIGSIGLCYGIIHYGNITVPADFAFAFLLSRPLKRIRLPVELTVAAAIAKVFPWLSSVKISALVRSVAPPGSESLKPRSE
eukprot:gb/GECG01014081.1/.p1 GENE.gb/GECG01014081.1/~~gb/GECG01014081.1/.p1  ORF type:complete len:199 (+),score=5.09 gb/GECG01014081.1/:1-597(+)